MGWLLRMCFFLATSFAGFIDGLHPLITYEAAPLNPPEKAATVIFGGDMMFDRTIRTTIDAKGGEYVFSCIDPTLRGADMVVANLEGPITGNTSVSATSTPGDEFNYTFTFPTSTAPLLYAHNVRIVNIGNNHILNFKIAGMRSTTATLRDAQVQYFGDPGTQSVATSTVRWISLAFINYNQFDPSTGSGQAASTTIAQIKAAREKGEIPIVYTHWGEEYATTSSAYSRELAHSFVDAGAEIVIGSHPHVVQEHEMYKGKNIYYSLGNFIFDQYWNDDVRHGLLLSVTFTQAGVQKIMEIPVELLHDRRTCPV